MTYSAVCERITLTLFTLFTKPTFSFIYILTHLRMKRQIQKIRLES